MVTNRRRVLSTSFDRAALGLFLRARREALQPEDVGLLGRVRRRTPGLRREDVADLCSISVDYVARLERGDGPQPSSQMAAALARGLRLAAHARGAGPPVPPLWALDNSARDLRAEHVSPGLLRVLDRLKDTPAQVMGPAGETLLQTAPAVALLGNQTQYRGARRSAIWR